MGINYVPKRRGLCALLVGTPPEYEKVEHTKRGRTHYFLENGFLQVVESGARFQLTWNIETQEDGSLRAIPALKLYPYSSRLKRNIAPLLQYLSRSIGKRSEEIVFGGDIIPEKWIPGITSHDPDTFWEGVYLLKSEVTEYLRQKLKELEANK